MEKMKPSLHWAVIMTAFGLSIAFTVLGFGYGWDFWDAFMVLGLGSLALIILGLAVLSFFLRKTERNLLWRSFADTIVQDRKALVCNFSRRP